MHTIPSSIICLSDKIVNCSCWGQRRKIEGAEMFNEMWRGRQEATSLAWPAGVKLDILRGGRAPPPVSSSNCSYRDAGSGKPIGGRHPASRALIGRSRPMRAVGIYLTWLQPLGLTIEPLFLSLVISFRDSCCNTQTPKEAVLGTISSPD